MRSLKRFWLTMAAVGGVALMIVAVTPGSADAHRRYRHGYHRPYLAGPPIVIRSSYYPVEYYYGAPYYYAPPYDYGYYGPYYDRRIYYSLGW